MILYCLICAETFKTYPSLNRKYCSRECSYKGKMFRVEITKCEWCAEKVIQTRKNFTKKYCSQTCISEFRLSKANDRNRMSCRKCLKSFIVNRRSRVKRKFCSKKCSVHYQFQL